MRLRKFFCVFLTCAVLLGCFTVYASAVSSTEPEIDILGILGSGQFRTDIPGDSYFTADMDFSLEAGDTVTIRASYSPKSANVDFGLIAPDGLFYASNTENGSISVTFNIEERGYYTLAVRNNSSNTVNVSGYVSY